LRICADENVAPKLTGLIREQLLSKGHSLATVDDYQSRGVDDQIWVRKFANAGGEAIIGGDFAMTKRAHEIVAIAEAGLRLVVLDQRWPREPRHIQISYLFYWWPHIENALAVMPKGACWKVPWGWGEPKNALRALPIDVQAAYAKLRKKG
jgi:hypothetical protein